MRVRIRKSISYHEMQEFGKEMTARLQCLMRHNVVLRNDTLGIEYVIVESMTLQNPIEDCVELMLEIEIIKNGEDVRKYKSYEEYRKYLEEYLNKDNNYKTFLPTKCGAK